MATQAQSFVETKIENNAKVYIRYNAGTDAKPEYRYLNGGGAWGTRAITDVHGVMCTLESTGTKYKINVGISNDGDVNGNRWLAYDNKKDFTFKLDKDEDASQGLYSSFSITRKEAGKNLFDISGAIPKTNYIKPGNNVGDVIIRYAVAFYWEIVTQKQLIKELESATESNPMDATFFIGDPGFGRNVCDSTKNRWKIVNVSNGDVQELKNSGTFNVGNTQIENIKGNDAATGMRSCLNVRNADGTNYRVQQTITGLPSGKYRLYVQGAASEEDGCFLFAAADTKELASVALAKNNTIASLGDAYQKVFSSGVNNYTSYIDVDVCDGTLVIGVENKSVKANAYIDNFELYYLGPTREFTPAAVAGTQWQEVTSASTDILNHPENYIFTIWQNDTTLLSLANGTEGMQETGYYTMSFVDGVKALDNNSYLWDIYKTTSGKYVFSNATYREGLLQAGKDVYFRFSKTSNDQEKYYNHITDSAVTTLVSGANNTWNINTLQGYLRRWSSTAKDIKVDNTDNRKGYFKLYAIPRIQYAVTEPYNRLMESLSESVYGVSGTFDASLAIANPSAAGKNNEIVGFGWNNTGNVPTCCYVGSADGHAVFLFNKGASRKLSQTLKGMPKGKYTLTARIYNISGSSSTDKMTLFIDDAQASLNAKGVITVTKEFLSDNNDIEIGALSNNSARNYNLDNFTLTYSVTGINETEEFYIRKNVGTEDYPEYLYFSGGNINTNAVMAKHGTSFTLEKNGVPTTLGSFTNVQYYNLHTNYYSSGTNVGYLGKNFEINGSDALKVWFQDKPNSLYGCSLWGDGTGYIHGGNVENSNLTSGGGTAMDFEVVNKEQLVRELSKASPYIPVDATFLIDDPNFSKGNTKKSSWKVVSENNSNSTSLVEGKYINIGTDNNINTGTALVANSGIQIMNDGSANKYVKAVVWSNGTDYRVQQTLTGIPNGWYRVSVQGIGSSQGNQPNGSGISMYLFADNGVEELKNDLVNYSNISNIESRFTNNTDVERKTIEVQVVNGTLVIGVKCGERRNATSYFDNFELYYLGEKSSEEMAEKSYNESPISFNVKAMDNMVEVKDNSSAPWLNPEDYFFTIWKDNTSCLALANGTDGYQGASYKTMALVSNPDLLNDKSCLWEFIKTADGKYVMVNMSDRNNMMQTETTANYFRYNNSTILSIEKASVSFEEARLKNWAIKTPQGYLYGWDKSCADVIVGGTVGYYKIYAIPRHYYVIDKPKAKYYATEVSPKDFTPLLVNPEGIGVSEDKGGILAWNASAESKFWTKEDNDETNHAASGKTYFNFGGENSTNKYRLSQSVNNLLAGNYKLSISSSDVSTASKLFVINNTTNAETSVQLKNNGDDDFVIELEFELSSDNTGITYGVECTGKNAIMFDKFRLVYYGVTDPIVEPLAAGGEYYIRKNIGTDAQPEYRYLDNGGLLWGTAAVFTSHGMEYKLWDTGSQTNGYTLYNLDSKIGTEEEHFIGYDTSEIFYNNLSKSNWFFIPRGDSYPFQYRVVYNSENKNIDYDATYTGNQSNVKVNDNAVYLEVVPKYQRLREFKNATMDKPVDATFLIKAPNFGVSDTRKSAWKYGANEADTLLFDGTERTVDNVGYMNNGGVFGSYDHNVMVTIKDASGKESFDFHQTIMDVPNGHYQIFAHGGSDKEDALKMYVSNGSIILEQITFDVLSNEAADDEGIMTNEKVGVLFRRDNTYRKSIEVDVADGKMVIGFTGNVADSKSFFDNIEMYYYGENGTNLTAAVPKEFSPKSMTSPWVEIKSASDVTSKAVLDNSDDYLFAIWSDATHCLALGTGTDGCQSSKCQTVTYVSTDCPWDDLSQMWEFYKDGNGKYILVNASARERLLQAEENSSFFRYNDATRQKLDRAVISIVESDKYNNWRIVSDYSSREFKRWGDAYNDIRLVPSTLGDYYKIYAIKRVDYYTEKQNILYNASALARMDVSLMLKNPEALGELNGKKHIGWTFENANNSNVAQELTVADTTSSKFSALNGKTYYEYRGDQQPTTQMYQTVTDLPRGIYLLSVLTTCAGTGAKIKAIGRVGNYTDNVDEELSYADSKSHIVYVPVYLPNDGGSITLGVDLSGYQHKKDPDAEEESSSISANYVVKFDHFVLQYMGVSATLASPLANGTYYIRTNLNEGTNDEAEYRYLDAGGNSWGTDPLLGIHGMSFYFNKRTDGKYSLLSEENQSGGKNGHYFDGAHFDHSQDLSQFAFVQVDPDNNPLKYMMYAYKATFSPGDVSTYSSYKKLATTGYVYLSSDGSTLDVDPNVTNNAAVWEIVTLTQRVKELQNASYDNPMDATFFIKDPSFGRNNVNKVYWRFNSDDNPLPERLGSNGGATTNSKSLDDGNTNISIGTEGESGSGNRYDFNVKVTGLKDQHSDYNLYQELAIDNLPAGMYRLSVHGYSNVSNGAVLYAKDDKKELGSLALTTSLAEKTYASNQAMAAYLFTNNYTMAEKNSTFGTYLKNNNPNEYFRDDLYYQSIEIKVTSNTLIVGVRGTLGKDDYAIFDNFELYYLGEAAQDIAEITEPVERYLYNVDAGLYLNKSDDLSENECCYVKKVGEKYVIAPVGGTSGLNDSEKKYYIYTEDINGKKYYLKPYGTLSVSYVSAIATNTTPYAWIISPLPDNNHMVTIKDDKGRILEWAGDAGNVVFMGYVNDKEPRGIRWAFYESGQYQKDRVFATIASATRSEGWRYVRSAKVNMRDLTGNYALAGLEEAYNKLDDVWSNPMSSIEKLTERINELKGVLIDAMSPRGTVKNPIDVSFFIQNAGLGDNIGWNGNWKMASTKASTRYSNDELSIPYVYQYLYDGSTELTQTIKNIPAGKYKLAVDFTTRGSNGSFVFFMKTLGTNGYTKEFSNIDASTYAISTFYSDDYIELDKMQDLIIGVKRLKGVVSVDNFKLYFDGNVRGKLKFNADSTEVTMLGDWDDEDRLYAKAKDVLHENLNTLGAMHIYKDNVLLENGVNVTNVGWQKGNDDTKNIGNNILFYTDFAEGEKALDGTSNAVDGDVNIVRKDASDTYSCDDLYLTDRMTMHVPYAFTATTASYSRANSINTGTLCLPFDLTTMPTGINSFYLPKEINWEESPEYGKLKLMEYSSNNDKVVLPANSPVFYEGPVNKASDAISVTENDALIHKTSELPTPKPEEDDISVYGTYKYRYVVGVINAENSSVKNADGLSAEECYYVKDNNKLVRGNRWFNVGAFRAFVYRGKNDVESGVRPSTLYIDFNDLFDAINELSKDENAEIVGYYDVKGIRYDTPQRGLNVILYSNGVRRKVYVK